MYRDCAAERNTPLIPHKRSCPDDGHYETNCNSSHEY